MTKDQELNTSTVIPSNIVEEKIYQIFLKSLLETIKKCYCTTRSELQIVKHGSVGLQVCL